MRTKTLRGVATEWNLNAVSRCRQLETGKDISHDQVLLPAVLQAAGRLSGKRILDLGCGCGFLASVVSRRARAVLGIDISTRMIREAERRFKRSRKLDFRALSIERLAQSGESRFDMCLANMSIITMPNLARTFVSISRVLKRRGRLVFSITHPSFWNSYRADEPEEAFNYWDSHAVTAPFRITLDPNPLPSPTTHFHHSIETYVRSLADAGFLIETIKEPRPPPSAPEAYTEHFRVPRFMVISVRKGT